MQAVYNSRLFHDGKGRKKVSELGESAEEIEYILLPDPIDGLPVSAAQAAIFLKEAIGIQELQ
jgi:hypothetical protein